MELEDNKGLFGMRKSRCTRIVPTFFLRCGLTGGGSTYDLGHPPPIIYPRNKKKRFHSPAIHGGGGCRMCEGEKLEITSKRG